MNTIMELLFSTFVLLSVVYGLAYSTDTESAVSSGEEIVSRTVDKKSAYNKGEKIYMKPSMEKLKNKLTSLQYKVTQKDGTEPAFNNEYWDNKEPGVYVDIVSGEPLFSSLDKFESGTGWPSFTKPLVPDNVVEIEDRSHLRTSE